MTPEEQDMSKTVKFIVNKDKKTVVCILTDRVYARTFKASTHCTGVDVFDESKGREIALNKARRKELEYHLNMEKKHAKALKEWYDKEKNSIDEIIERLTNDIDCVLADLAEVMPKKED